MTHSLKDLAFTILANSKPIKVTSIEFKEDAHISHSIFNVKLPRGENMYREKLIHGYGYMCLRYQHIVPEKIRRGNKHRCKKVKLGKPAADLTKKHQKPVPTLQLRALTTIIKPARIL